MCRRVVRSPCVSVLCGLGMTLLAIQLFRRREGEEAAKAAGQLFAFSILYLCLLFATLLAEHGLGLMRPIPGWSA